MRRDRTRRDVKQVAEGKGQTCGNGGIEDQAGHGFGRVGIRKVNNQRRQATSAGVCHTEEIRVVSAGVGSVAISGHQDLL